MSNDKRTESLKKAQKRYYGKCRTYILRFRLDNDADIIERIESMPNKAGYVRALVREDIRKRAADSPRRSGATINPNGEPTDV